LGNVPLKGVSHLETGHGRTLRTRNNITVYKDV
jgi:hypothetical protein